MSRVEKIARADGSTMSTSVLDVRVRTQDRQSVQVIAVAPDGDLDSSGLVDLVATPRLAAAS